MELALKKERLKLKLSLPKTLIIEPHKFSILKIIAHKDSCNDSQIEKLLNTVSNYTTPFLERFEYNKTEKALIYHPNQVLSFETLFTTDKISFYYVIPTIFKNVFMNKAKFTLTNFTIQELEDTDDYLHLFDNSYKQEFKCANHWFSSINTSNKILLNDSLMVLHKDLLTNKDMVLLQHLIKPVNESKWKPKWDALHKKFSNTGVLPSSFDIGGTLDKGLDFIIYQLDLFLNAFMGTVFGADPYEINKKDGVMQRVLCDDTRHKTLSDGFRIKTSLYVKSNNNVVVNNVVRDAVTVFKDLDSDDNKIVLRGKPKVVNIANRELKKGDILNTKECKQLFKIVSPAILKSSDYANLIDVINTTHVDMPREIFNPNYLQLGEIKNGSVYKPISFGNHLDSLSKPLVFLAPQEGGKSTFIRSYALSAVEKGHSVVAFDTVDGKNVSVIRDRLAGTIPDEKIIVLNFANDEYIFPLLWNEVSDDYLDQLNKTSDKLKKYRILEEFSNAIGTELIQFIDTLKSGSGGREQGLTDAMKSILTLLAQLVFMNQGTFSQIKDCLYDQDLRHQLLAQLNLPRTLPFVKNILKLDRENEASTTLRGIETRLNRLMENSTIQKYFSIKTEKKIDFSKWINEGGYCILINVPEKKFKSSINSIVTFLVQKLWLATLSSRYNIPEDKRIPCHLLLDEMNKFPRVVDLLTDNIIASRKWRLRFIFMIHSIGIFRMMQENLKSSGASFMIVPPTSPQNISALSSFYYPFGADELHETERLMQKYNGKLRFAMCSIHYKNTNYPCIVKLPLPPERRYKYIDRSYLNERYAKEYGLSEDIYYSQFFDEDDDECVDMDVDFAVD